MKALFIIDMQEEYVGIGNRYGYDSKNLILNVNERILQAEEDGEMIIYIKNKKKLRSGVCIPEFVEDLEIRTPFIFCKEKSSLFSNNEISQLLNDRNVTEIETIGVDGNCCVASSALDAANEGYKVIFPCRYVGVKNAKRFVEKKKQLIKAGIKIIGD